MLTLTLLLAALAGPPASQESLSPEAMRADLAQLAADVRANWAYFDDRTAHLGVALDAWVAEASEGLSEPAAPDEFALVLRRIVADLSDGHARLEVPGTSPAPGRQWPLVLREVSEGLAVARLAGDLEGTLAGLRLPEVGDLLLAADGRDVERLWAGAQRLCFASTPRMRAARALRSMALTDARAVAFEFERPDGTRTSVDLPTLAAGAPELRDPPEPAWSVDQPRPGIARLRLASLAMPDWRAWLDADQPGRDALLAEVEREIDELFARLVESSPRALLLDLRGNGGGTDAVGIRFAEHLLPDEFVYYRLSALRDGRWSEPHGTTEGAQDDLARVACPVVALIDEGCFSATDNLLRALDVQHPDLTTVGRPSGGGTGAPRVISELDHSGARLTLCTLRVYAADDTLIEGRGTQPDVPVFWSRSDLLAGRDPDLELALQLLASRGLLGP